MPARPSVAPLVVEVDDGGRISCPPDTSVLRAMVAAGRRDVPVGCRSGGCGVCRVRVVHGEYETGRMSAAQVNGAEAATGIALACQLFPRTDLRIAVIGRRQPPTPPEASIASTHESTINARRSAQ